MNVYNFKKYAADLMTPKIYPGTPVMMKYLPRSYTTVDIDPSSHTHSKGVYRVVGSYDGILLSINVEKRMANDGYDCYNTYTIMWRNNVPAAYVQSLGVVCYNGQHEEQPTLFLARAEHRQIFAS